MTNRVLEELIRFYGDKIVAMMGPYLEQQILQSLASQDQIREHLTKAFTQPYPTPEQAIKSMIEQYQVFTGQVPPTDSTRPGEAPADDLAGDEDGGRPMRDLLERQKAASIRDGLPRQQTRIERLDKSIELLCDHSDALCEAMSADFGHRSIDQSRFSDISGSIDALKYAKKHVRSWMRPEKRATQFPLGLFGARAAVHYQPKGVVGIISPWNFPVNLTFAPLAGVLAAGNRAMIKPSEFTEQTSALMAKLFAKYYEEDEVAVVTGGADVGAEFSSLPFDHLVFTGATSIARHVMRAAAENLVPVTLELGGKSPVIIGESADLKKAALRIMSGKTLNAGQICLAPDYVFLPQGKESEFVEAATSAAVIDDVPGRSSRQ